MPAWQPPCPPTRPPPVARETCGGRARARVLGRGPLSGISQIVGTPTAPSREWAGRSAVSSPLFLLEGSGLPSLTAAAQSLWGGVSTQRSPPGLLPSGLPGGGVCSTFLSTSGLTRCQTPAPAQGVRVHRPARAPPPGAVRPRGPVGVSHPGGAGVPPSGDDCRGGLGAPRSPCGSGPGCREGAASGGPSGPPPANWGMGSGRPVRPWLVRCSFPGRWRFAARRGRGPQTQGEEEPPGLPCWRPCFQNLPHDPLSWGLGCLGPGGGLVSMVLHFYTTFPLLSLLPTLSSPLHPP